MPKTSIKSNAGSVLSLNKTEQWKLFQKSVLALADQIGIPEGKFTLGKVREKSGKKSDAWKYHERDLAQKARDVGFTQAHRVLRGDDIGISDIDVRIPEIPTAQIDCKYRQDGWSHHSIFFECEDKYCVKSGDFLLLPTKGGGETGSLTTMRTEVAMQLLAAKYLQQEKPPEALGCPRCPGIVTTKESSLGLTECVCSNCSLSYLMRSEDVPKGASEATRVIKKTAGPVYPLEVESTAIPFGGTKSPEANERKSRKKRVA